MKTAEERLRERAARIPTFRRAPLRGTLRSVGEDEPIRPQMSDAEYARLVARGEQQAWTVEDERRLAARAARLRK